MCTVNIIIIINLTINFTPKTFMVSVITQSKLNMIGGYLATRYEKNRSRMYIFTLFGSFLHKL